MLTLLYNHNYCLSPELCMSVSFFSYHFLHSLTCVHIIWATYLSFPGRTCSILLFLNFAEEKTGDNRKDIPFLLVWGKDSYTQRFLALLPCTCVLQPTFVHLYQTSSLLPCPLPIVASVSLRLLYSLLHSEHINYIQVLGSLPFLYSSCGYSPLNVWPMSNDITAFVLGL
jgi:hypothetical protein